MIAQSWVILACAYTGNQSNLRPSTRLSALISIWLPNYTKANFIRREKLQIYGQSAVFCLKCASVLLYGNLNLIWELNLLKIQILSSIMSTRTCLISMIQDWKTWLKGCFAPIHRIVWPSKKSLKRNSFVSGKLKSSIRTWNLQHRRRSKKKESLSYD